MKYLEMPLNIIMSFMKEMHLELTTYSVGKRKHAMKALAAFSKYSGCYERWQKIRKELSTQMDFN